MTDVLGSVPSVTCSKTVHVAVKAPEPFNTEGGDHAWAGRTAKAGAAARRMAKKLRRDDGVTSIKAPRHVIL